MGLLRKGIFDGFENKTGPLIGRRVNGKNVITALQHKSLKPRTASQLNHQLKFALVVSFLSRFKGIIAEGFGRTWKNGSAFNKAVKVNYKHLITGTAPGYSINYKNLIYSQGCLAGPNTPSAVLLTAAVKVSWLPDRQSRFNQYGDKASFLAHCPAKNVTLMLLNKVRREAQEYTFELPPDLTGSGIYVFMSFTSADGKAVSDSRYIGMV